MSSQDTLRYIFESDPVRFSLHPHQVDRGANTVLAKALISTLLTTDRSHRRVSGLASRWTASSDFRTWRFEIKDGYRCEDGSLIDNRSFVKTFSWLLKIHAEKNPRISLFSSLQGWNDFISGKSKNLLGVQYEGANVVRFDFEKPVDSGILAFLSIPQFGYYCVSNFNDEGTWIGDKKFFSAGPYKLSSDLDARQVEISLRDNWNAEGRKLYRKVIFEQHSKVTSSDIFGKDTFVILKSGSDIDVPSGFVLIEGSRIQLVSAILTPFMENLFSNKRNRQIFRYRMLNWLDKNPLPSPQLSRAFSFYPEALDNNFQGENFGNKGYSVGEGQSGKVLKIVYNPNIPQNILRYLIDSIRYCLEGTSYSLNVEPVDRSDSNSVRRYLSNRDYDVRLNWGVISGMSNWIIDMMFCSSVGMCLPDSGGKVCQLVERHNENPLSENEYREAFNAIIREESTVIPIYHSGARWVFGPGIQRDGISPLSPIPYVEHLEML